MDVKAVSGVDLSALSASQVHGFIDRLLQVEAGADSSHSQLSALFALSQKLLAWVVRTRVPQPQRERGVTGADVGDGASPAYLWFHAMLSAAQRIQRVWRGYRHRKHFNQLLEQLVFQDRPRTRPSPRGSAMSARSGTPRDHSKLRGGLKPVQPRLVAKPAAGAGAGAGAAARAGAGSASASASASGLRTTSGTGTLSPCSVGQTEAEVSP